VAGIGDKGDSVVVGLGITHASIVPRTGWPMPWGLARSPVLGQSRAIPENSSATRKSR
jgi:hypothetical protein